MKLAPSLSRGVRANNHVRPVQRSIIIGAFGDASDAVGTTSKHDVAGSNGVGVSAGVGVGVSASVGTLSSADIASPTATAWALMVVPLP